MPVNKIIAFLGVAVVVAILVFVVMSGRETVFYNNCLRTWPSEWQLSISESYGITTQDLCKKGYTLPQFIAFEENITQRILREDHFLTANDERFKVALRDIIRKSVLEESGSD